jgi:hypothetical protein
MIVAAAALSAVASTQAAAQVLDLSGRFRCVAECADGLVGQPALVAQHGWDMRLVNEAGVPARAWIDHPGHIWVESAKQGAVYSPDGLTIQFDSGTVWRRDLGVGGVVAPLPAPPPQPSAAPPAVAPSAARPAPLRREAALPVERAPAASNAFDGNWSVVIYTRSGGCDPSARFGVRIANGQIANGFGDAVNAQGHVSPNGAIRVSVSAGPQTANGEGRLNGSGGTGLWRGKGSAGSCSGVWQASRRD